MHASMFSPVVRRSALAFASGTGQRTLSSASAGARRQPKACHRATWKGSFPALLAPSLTTLALMHHYFSTSTHLHAESSSSRSSSVFRPADSAALRRPASQLVFMSHNEEHRDEWQRWIGYFRQAGYDCIDLNVALQSEENTEALSEELGAQVRLMSLQRPPLLFAYSGPGAQIALQHVQSSKPKVSGLVLVSPKGSDRAALEKAKGLDVNKLRILILKDEENKDAFRTAERWMDAQGLS